MTSIIESPFPDVLMKGIPVLNAVSNELMRELIERIAKSYGTNCLNTTEEVKWLQEKCEKGDENGLQSAVLAIAYIIQKAAYKLAKTAVLESSLEQLHLDPGHIEIFSESWAALAKDLVESLRKRTFVPLKVENVNASVHVEVANQYFYPGKAPLAQIAWGLSNRDGEKATTLVTEYNYGELLKLYETLEEIQESLDAISS